MLLSCSSPKALPPAYLQLDSARVVLERDTLQIEAPIDAWVYPQGRFLSVVEPGEYLPIVPATQQPILLAGGVRVNGLGAVRRPYPFWQFDTLPYPLAPEQTYTYRPTYTYFPDTLLEYLLREDFESPQMALRVLPGEPPGRATLRRLPNHPRRGFWAAEISLPPATTFQAEAATPFEFPKNELWAEISLRGDRNLGVGLTVENRQTGAVIERQVQLILRPPDVGWGTFYIDLLPWLRQKGTLYRYRLYLTSQSDSTRPATLYLDDLRLITFRSR
ncbi:MAG: hypothetical protein ABDH91_04445 [Bacteroidia bacterium]